jgi:hypothetical protein
MRKDSMQRISTWRLTTFTACAAIAIIATLGAGCGRSGDLPDGGVRRSFSNEHARVVVEVDDTTITVAETTTLTVSITIAEDYSATLQDPGDSMGEFSVIDRSTSPPRLVDGQQVVVTDSFVLEPFLSGEYAVSPLTIITHKKGDQPTTGLELSTDAIAITVSSVLPADSGEPQIHDIAGPVSMPRSWKTALIVLVILVMLVAGIAIAAVLLGRRQQKQSAGPVTPPHEIALEALKRLLALDLVGQGQIKVFYQRLSDILRHYIENRFAIHAQEQTTEEFLALLGSNHRLRDDHKQLLKVFLKHCDLVKFAEHQPGTDDIENTVGSCRDFVNETIAATDDLGRTTEYSPSPPQPQVAEEGEAS